MLALRALFLVAVVLSVAAGRALAGPAVAVVAPGVGPLAGAVLLVAAVLAMVLFLRGGRTAPSAAPEGATPGAARRTGGAITAEGIRAAGALLALAGAAMLLAAGLLARERAEAAAQAADAAERAASAATIAALDR